jgi:hypothetical protein
MDGGACHPQQGLMRNRFMTSAPLLLGLAAALALAGGAQAQVYKWVDEKGVVNYSSTPPPTGGPAVMVDESKGRVTTVPAPEVQRDAAASGDPALRRRVEQLEREAAAQRQMAAQQDAAAAEAYRRWREQCLAERRVDCDDPYRGSLEYRYDYGYGYAYPPSIRPPVARPLPVVPGWYRPTPYIAQGAGGVVGPYYQSPPGGVALGPGPYGIGAGLNPAPRGGVVLGPGPGGIGSAYYPVPESMAPKPPPRPQPRTPELRR